MNIKLTAKNVEIPAEVKEYVKEKFAKLEKFSSRIQAAEVVIRGGERQIHCEAIIRIDNRGSAIIDVSGETMQEAVDMAVSKCERQLTREKERYSERRRQGADKKNPEGA